MDVGARVTQDAKAEDFVTPGAAKDKRDQEHVYEISGLKLQKFMAE